MAERDPRVYLLIYLIFIVCVLSTPAAALTPFFLYVLFLLLALRISALSAIPVLRKTGSILPAILMLGLVMFFTRHGVLDRLLVFWNLFAKAFLATAGTIIYVNIAGSFEFVRKPGFNKNDLRVLFGVLIILTEIRLLGG